MSFAISLMLRSSEALRLQVFKYLDDCAKSKSADWIAWKLNGSSYPSTCLAGSTMLNSQYFRYIRATRSARANLRSQFFINASIVMICGSCSPLDQRLIKLSQFSCPLLSPGLPWISAARDERPWSFTRDCHKILVAWLGFPSISRGSTPVTESTFQNRSWKHPYATRSNTPRTTSAGNAEQSSPRHSDMYSFSASKKSVAPQMSLPFAV